MSTPIVPSVGPVLSSGGGRLINAGVRQTNSAAPAAPAPAATAPIFSPLEEIPISTTDVNEAVRVTLGVQRSNPGRNGTYQLTVDGLPLGPLRNSPLTVGPDGSTIIDALLFIAAPGAHSIGAQVTSNAAIETVYAGANMLVQANQFV